MEVLTPVEFRPFIPGDEAAFRELNEAWIAGNFVVEEKDWEVLNDPVTYILQPGGALVMAVRAAGPPSGFTWCGPSRKVFTPMRSMLPRKNPSGS